MTKLNENKLDSKLSDDNKINIMNAIKQIVVHERLKQKEIAKILDIKQPRVSDLLSIKYDRFSLDILIQYLTVFGCKISITATDSLKGTPIKVNTLKSTKAYRTIAR